MSKCMADVFLNKTMTFIGFIHSIRLETSYFKNTCKTLQKYNKHKEMEEEIKGKFNILENVLCYFCWRALDEKVDVTLMSVW